MLRGSRTNAVVHALPLKTGHQRNAQDRDERSRRWKASGGMTDITYNYLHLSTSLMKMCTCKQAGDAGLGPGCRTRGVKSVYWRVAATAHALKARSRRRGRVRDNRGCAGLGWLSANEGRRRILTRSYTAKSEVGGALLAKTP
eukprot:6172267-Pleurochrysis_carterae.AAC.1